MLSMVDALPALDPSMLDLTSSAPISLEVQDLLTPLADETLDAMDTMMSAQGSVSELVRPAHSPRLPAQLFSPRGRASCVQLVCGGSRRYTQWSGGVRMETDTRHPHRHRCPLGGPRNTQRNAHSHPPPVPYEPSHHRRRALRVAGEGASAPSCRRPSAQPPAAIHTAASHVDHGGGLGVGASLGRSTRRRWWRRWRRWRRR